MFKFNEVKKWAKENNFIISKLAKVEEYYWDGNKYTDLRSLVIDLWNKKTNNAYVEYQEEYKKEYFIK
jgi:hypothetical protein